MALISFLSGVLGAGLYGYATKSTPVANLVAQNKQVTLQENSATIDLVKKVSPSVVSITTSSAVRSIFGLNQSQQGAGTGIIVTSDGLILTNKHVVEGASSFTVTTTDGRQYTGKLIATDPANDVAFLRVEASGLQAAELGDSDKVEVGQRVVAIGNALGQFANTVTTGVISGKSRPIEASDGSGGMEQLTNLFQTDAAINPGNSGGPLLNIEGQVIGINTAIAGQNAQNIGFAIPINEVKTTLDTVKTTGKIERPYLGVRYVMLTQAFAERNNLPVKEGALLRGDDQTLAVVSGSPAQKAGLREGDIITKIGDKDVNTKTPLSNVVVQFKVGQTVDVKYYRDGNEQTAKVTFEVSPAN
ncbi:trypsin-like peptidase domain-containing protein [bacterium]|nr:trypsin-like peptidase domain-containing protein [bacterium]